MDAPAPETPVTTSTGISRAHWIGAALVSGAAFASYLLTLTPSLSYLSPDGSELATVPAVLGLAHSPGYPLYTWLGYLFSLLPLGDVAHRINLMSAFLGALGVGGLFLAALQMLPARQRRQGDSRERRHEDYLVLAAGLFAALAFAFSATFWSQALIAEVYAPNVFMIAITLLALLCWERKQSAGSFFLFALLFGLSSGTHISNLGFAPGFIVFILLVNWRVLLNLRWWPAALGGFGLGLLQFAWLPLRASMLNDRQMLARAPIDLAGIYNYTLGAFPQFKFAFALTALPDRLVTYLIMLRQEFGWFGILLGLVGLFGLLFRRPRYYFLLVLMYLVHIWFFIQYSVFDLEVFFIPAHFLWAIFIAFGVREALAGALLGLSRLAHKRLSLGFAWVRIGLTLLLFVPLLATLSNNWAKNDASQDTAINDFYANVWQILPANAALLTSSGVFGYDAFYWRLIYNTRPDVLLPAINNPDPNSDLLQGRPLFSTQSGLSGQGPSSLPRDLVRGNVWAMPRLYGESPAAGAGPRQQLVLYEMTYTTPQLKSSPPANPLNMSVAGFDLLDVSPGQATVESGGRLDITLIWRIPDQISALRSGVTLQLNEITLTRFAVGQGLLDRALNTGLLKQGDVFSDHFMLVVPALLPPGEYTLRLVPQGGEPLEVARVKVVDEKEMVELWLQTAGKSGSD